MRIVIPGLLSAPVVPIPLDAHELVPPDDPAVVGWFPFYKPGQAGTVVLAAHATSATSVGALEYIDKLRPGNVIAVEVKGGSVFRYRVSDVFAAVTKPRSARLSSRMFSDHSGELVLVTSALYDPVTGKWNGNDVVFAALIG